MAFAFDWASLKRTPVVKQLVGILAVCLLAYATVMVCISPARSNLPTFTIPLGSCLLLVSSILLIYSLFIEIPFWSTYAGQGAENKLVTTGTYALVRHPGVIWLALVYLSLVLLFPSATLFLAVTIWLSIDVVYVALQEKFIFAKMFPEYNDYQRRTPFLIPTRQSLLACIRTIKHRWKAGE